MTVFIKVIILALFAFIFFSLGSALYYLVRGNRGDSERIVKALTWRISLSIVLFIILMIAFALGWITPHSV
jgi:putative copper export protein